METAIFLLFALLAVASSLVVILHKNPVYSTMSLVVTLFSVAVLFVLLGAPFIAAIQILVYTGAIVVLFLFVVMLLNITREESSVSQQKVQFGGAVLGSLLFGGMLVLLFWNASRTDLDPITQELVSMKGLARQMFTEFLLPFEIVGLLLLVAVIGATVAARKPPQPEKPMEDIEP
ncbi:MAG TPA: NADH-quinone oxidoreductase subunit J [Thermoanaerobaculia bacterium]|nr:NADH-quinone oxidoreductase subunit J [Thermoanaerobaculia bacterium]